VGGKKEPEPQKVPGKEADAKGQEVEEKGEPGHVGIAEEVGAKLVGMKLPPDEAEAEKLLQETGDKLSTEYSGRLEPGVKLRVRVTDPPADADQNVDFEVVIAPNTTKLKFTAHTPGYLPAEAGTYGTLTANAGVKNTDGSGREAHHAPPVALAVALGDSLTDVGDDLLDTEDDKKGVILLDVGQQLRAAAQSGGHGDDLSAILLHEETHKHHGGTGPRIHGSEMRQHLGKYLRGRKLSDVARTKAKGEVVVNPGTGSFERQISRVAENVSEEDTLTAAMAADGPEIVKRIYEAESSRAIGAVEVALSKSKKDGTADQRRSAIAGLKRSARETWLAMIKQVKWN
jgi:hypothetical protein